MKLKHIAIIGSLFPILFSLVLFFGVLISADSDDENSNFSSGITGMNLSAEVLKHQPMVEKYAREYGISEYVNVLLAIIQVESGGTAEDVMQSSESLGLPPNSLDTENSIKQGCKYFASLLSSCKNQGIDDLNVAIQSYNYGGGYVGYVAVFQVLSIVLLVLHRLSAVASNYYLGLHILSGRLHGTSGYFLHKCRRGLHTNQRYR